MGEELRVEPLLLRIEWTQLQFGHLVRMPPGCLPGVPGMPIQEETPGKTKNMLERLYLSADLGTSLCLPGRAGGSGWGEECLDLPTQAVPTDLDPDKQKKMK